MEDDCWLWAKSVSSNGYATITVNIDGKKVGFKAHRVMYENEYGTIPDGLVIDHICRVRRCINPKHLDAVTPRENTRRSPIATASINFRKTHCYKGHEFDESNTYLYKRRGYRICRTCAREKMRIIRTCP